MNIPAEIDGERVVGIGDGAVKMIGGIKRIIIPDGVTRIGDYAFYSCTGLSSIDIPNGVTYIGEFAFCKCSGILANVFIPDSVEKIGHKAFYDCIAPVTYKGKTYTPVDEPHNDYVELYT